MYLSRVGTEAYLFFLIGLIKVNYRSVEIPARKKPISVNRIAKKSQLILCGETRVKRRAAAGFSASLS